MTDEMTVCAAAFFRTIGKDVTTSDEFVMVTSLELKWMSPSDSKLLLKMLLTKGVLARKGDFIRPNGDLSGLDLPLAYKPSQDLVDAVHGRGPLVQSKPEAAPDMFHILMDVALKNGIQAKDFVPACSKIQKKLDVDISVAALIVLRDSGVDIEGRIEPVYDGIRSM